VLGRDSKPFEPFCKASVFFTKSKRVTMFPRFGAKRSEGEGDFFEKKKSNAIFYFRFQQGFI
jgi:hypothetical protein